jgi:hypothetical protein
MRREETKHPNPAAWNLQSFTWIPDESDHTDE